MASVNHCWFTQPQVRASLTSLDEGHGNFGSWKGNDAVRLCIMRIPGLLTGFCLRAQGRGRERVGLFKEQNWKLTLDKMVMSFKIRIYCRALCFCKYIHPTTSEMIHKHLKDGQFSKLIIPLLTTQSHTHNQIFQTINSAFVSYYFYHLGVIVFQTQCSLHHPSVHLTTLWCLF